MRARICIVTTAQPTTNPRVVKEADVLSAAGHHVQVVGAFAGQWAIDADPDLLAGRAWTFDLVDWRRERNPRLWWTSRVRHRAASRLAVLPGAPMRVVDVAASRPTPELTARACAHPADLYIAHNLGALPAAVQAARRHRGLVGFDAEDFHSGQFMPDSADPMRRVAERVERRYLPLCHYVTAASPGIADAYRPLVRGAGPRSVLNVWPLSERPSTLRDALAASGGGGSARRPGAIRMYWFSQTIGPSRGLEDIVRAMAPLPDGMLELHLRGTWAPGYESSLRRLAAACGLASERLVAHPPAPASDMIALASEFDLGLALEPGDTPNSRILISNKIFTYFTAGIAVIASRTAGQQWVLERAAAAGWLYTPGDVDGLSALLATEVRDRRRLEAASRAAAVGAATRFCWEREQHELLREVESVLERRVRAATTGTAAALVPAGDGRTP